MGRASAWLRTPGSVIALVRRGRHQRRDKQPPKKCEDIARSIQRTNGRENESRPFYRRFSVAFRRGRVLQGAEVERLMKLISKATKTNP